MTMKSFFDSIDYKDIISVSDRDEYWYYLNPLLEQISGRVDDLKVHLLRDYEFLTKHLLAADS